MEDILWFVTFVACSICTGTGMLAWRKNPESTATKMFLLANIAVTIAMLSARMTNGLGENEPDAANIFSKLFASSLFIALTLFWQMTIVFPVELRVSFRPPNLLAVTIIVTLMLSVVVGSFSKPITGTPVGTTAVSRDIAAMMVVAFIATPLIATAFSIHSRNKASENAKHSSTLYVVGLWMIAVSGVTYAADIVLGHRHAVSSEYLTRLPLIITVTGVMLYFASSMILGNMSIAASPASEKMASAMKSKFKLLHRRVYLVEEPKPTFGMELFLDILKGRCFDCANDDSFACESLNCGSCNLPCPCKKCEKYDSRTQGLVVTRQYPIDIRQKYFLQTTPIIWLSTVAGKDNMDPAKLSLLSDFLMSSMEKTQNGVVLVDGIEYLITSNDFQRVLRAIDRWTETAMASRTRLLISVDPKAFDEKELALLERNREVVRPEASEPWKVIPEPI
jgi:hypothetical protein